MPVYFGQKPKNRTSFKEFVIQCVSIDESMAKSFWRSRFDGIPAIYPGVDHGFPPRVRQEETRQVDLKCMGHTVLHGQLPSFIEAALALTLGIYVDSEAVAFGSIFSGRSSDPNGIEATLGP